MQEPDIRWKQRFSNFDNALARLTEAVELSQKRPLSNIEKSGFIKTFELTHELAWNVMKDYFQYQGSVNIMGSRDATREAFQKELVTDGESWMSMIKTRNKAVYTYDDVIANEIIEITISKYHQLLLNFKTEILSLESDNCSTSQPLN